MPSLQHTLPALLLLLPTSISAFTFDCTHIRVDKQSFNLEKLGGPKTVHNVVWEKPSIENTTFTLDICAPLPKEPDLKKDQQCDTGTWICGREYDYHSGDGEGFVKRVIPIAGQYSASHGRNRNMDPKFSRLKDSATSSEKEGVVVELHGGKYDGRSQKAIIEFLCDKNVTGNEGFEDEAKMLDGSRFGSMKKREDDDDNDDDDDEGPDLPNLDEGKQLKFISYKPDTGKFEGDVLRLSWHSKYACEGVADSPDSGDDDGAKKTAGWGFFTWFIIILFLLAAAYIIFGSWLNYNRYGARGWDLIPHGDTIRDIPYIVKDWGSSMADRLKGGDTRGGYSAV